MPFVRKRRAERRGRLMVVQMTTVPQSLAFLSGQPTYLRQHGFEVTVVTSPGEGAETFGQREETAVVQVPMERRISPARDLLSFARLVRLFRRTRPDLVHAHTPKAALLGMLAAWVARVPARVFHVHGLPVMTARGAQRVLLSLTDRLSAGLAHQVIFVSESLRDDAIARKLCPPGKSRVLASGSANGIDAETRFNPEIQKVKAQAAAQQLGIGHHSQVVGFVGRLVIDKGVLDLLAAWTCLKTRYPDARLLVVGPEEEADSIPDEAKRHIRTDPSIIWVPWTDQPEVLLAIMHVVVLPSYREGFPLSLLEASAMALPVVTCNLPGMRDAVVDGVTGSLVEKGDIDALGKAIVRYLDERDVARKHGAAGRVRALTDFSPQRVWEELADTYATLVFADGSATRDLPTAWKEDREPPR